MHGKLRYMNIYAGKPTEGQNYILEKEFDVILAIVYIWCNLIGSWNLSEMKFLSFGSLCP